VGVNDRGNGIRRVMETVDKLEAQRQSERKQQENGGGERYILTEQMQKALLGAWTYGSILASVSAQAVGWPLCASSKLRSETLQACEFRASTVRTRSSYPARSQNLPF
jgi:hypothetical protein